MEPNKVSPRSDYNYTAKVPDFLTFNGMLFGFGLYYYYNMKFINYTGATHMSRLKRAGKQLPFFLMGGALVGSALATVKNNFLKKRIVYMEEYIASHPEDFQELPKKKFGDVLHEWYPCR